MKWYWWALIAVAVLTAAYFLFIKKAMAAKPVTTHVVAKPLQAVAPVPSGSN